MPNSYFQFKQFKIKQDKCAMKVCTDACLFGAIVSKTIKNKNKVLDIGAGTGLLSIMYAQKNIESKIDAVEIDADACEQAQQNINDSEWNNIELFNQSIQDFTKDKCVQYDLIISNPPFFEKHLKSNDEQRNKALHSSELTLNELLLSVRKLLKNNGIFAVLLPYSRMSYMLELAGNESLFLQKAYFVRQSEKHDFFRTIMTFTKTPANTEKEIITIKEKTDYSLRFKELLKDYYLRL